MKKAQAQVAVSTVLSNVGPSAPEEVLCCQIKKMSGHSYTMQRLDYMRLPEDSNKYGEHLKVAKSSVPCSKQS